MMNFKMNLRKWLLLVGVALSFNVFGQPVTDSLNKVRQDSLLLVTQKKGKQMLQQADSVHLADSIKQSELLRQIEELKSRDTRKKEALQRQLDSLKVAQEERDQRVKMQVDSLRAHTKGVPVIIFRDTLFYIYSRLGSFSPNDRAENIRTKLEHLVESNQYSAEKLAVFQSEGSFDIMHGETVLFSINDRDAFWENKPNGELAEQYRDIIEQSIANYKKSTSVGKTMLRIGMILLAILLLYLLIRYLNKGFNWLINWTTARSDRYINGIKFRNYEFISAQRELELVTWAMKALKLVLIIFAIYLSLPVIFSVFPATEGVARALIGYILNPLKTVFKSIIGYIPEFITIVVIVTLAHYVVRFTKFLSSEVEAGKLNIPNFHPEWARPTFGLFRIFIVAFTFVMIFPYLPGSDSPVFQGVSVFLGFLFTFGSAGSLSNIIAGGVLTYMRVFKIGDRVKIGEITGDIIEKSMLVTRVRTIKNEIISIPNSTVMNSHTVNYSSDAPDNGLIIYTTVTIGYDVPWKDMHAALIEAALRTEHILKDPAPFVLQTSLDDFYVSYQINGYTREPNLQAEIYSDLHQNIQDACNEAGIEIMSPHYRAERDGNQTTVPANYLPKDYAAPSFRITNPPQKQ